LIPNDKIGGLGISPKGQTQLMRLYWKPWRCNLLFNHPMWLIA